MSSIRWVVIVVVMVGWVVASRPAHGHFATIAFSHIDATSDRVTWEIALDPYHVRELVVLDHDADGYVDADEVAASRPDLVALVGTALELSHGGVSLSPTIGRVAMVTAGERDLPEPWRPADDFPLVLVEATFDLPPGGGSVDATYRLLDHPDVEEHQNVTTAVTPVTSYLHVFDEYAPALTLAIGAPTPDRAPTGPVDPRSLAVGVGAALGVGALALSRSAVRH